MVDRFDYADYEFTLRDRQWNREMQSGYVTHSRGCHNLIVGPPGQPPG